MHEYYFANYRLLVDDAISSIAKNIDECLHQTEDKLAQTIPMWHLECLPDEAAARLCHDTITNRNKEGVIE